MQILMICHRKKLAQKFKKHSFLPIFGPRISFLQFYPGELSPIIPKPLLIDSTIKNRSSKVYLGFLAYQAENARKAFYFHIAMCLRVLRDALVSQARGLWLEQVINHQ